MDIRLRKYKESDMDAFEPLFDFGELEMVYPAICLKSRSELESWFTMKWKMAWLFYHIL